MNISSVHWNWTEFCPTGITPWAADSNDLLPCFQEICLQMPVLTVFATFSAYQFGSLQKPVSRNRTQLRLIYFRILLATLLAFIPVLKTLILKSGGLNISPADVLVTCSKCVTWMVHVGYLLSLRRYGGLSHRGSLFLNVVWTLIFTLDIVWLRTSMRYFYWEWSMAVVVLNCIFLICLLPKGHSVSIRNRVRDQETDSLLGNRYVHFETEFDEMTLGHAQDEANTLSKLCFYWVNPLITKGVAGNLRKVEDLFDLPEVLNISRITDRLHEVINRSKSLIWSLHVMFGKEFYLIGILRLTADISSFAGPLLLGGLLRQNSSERAGTDIKPYLYAIGLFCSTIIAAFCGTHFNWKMAIVGLKIRIGVVSAIYRKALEARGLHEARPEVLNLMSTDTDRIVNSVASFHSFWSIPFQLFTTLYLLYTQLGVAFLAGVLFAAALIPVNRWLAVKIGKISEGLMTAKDARLSVTSQTIIGAKQIKLQAWEDVFINKIQDLRKTEVKFLAKRKYLDALCVYFWATTPVLMCLLTFGMSTLMGNPLTASTTYTSVALLNMLIGPLNAFPWVLNGLVEAWISVKRVQELLNLPNLDFSEYYKPIVEDVSENTLKLSVLQMKDACFRHDVVDNQNQKHAFELENVNIDIKKGDLVCIEGPVGGGKSTLISAIVACSNCTTGTVSIQSSDLHSGFGYAPETAWLQRGTIRENILWGSVFEEQKYKNIIHACGLYEDLEILGGDHVGVGEGGRTLSGGQRMRVALARAIYQDKEIYVIDDILASLDAHVANHIIKHCFLHFLKDKTRIIVTQNRALFYHANQVLYVEDGVVVPSNYMVASYAYDEIEDVSQSRPVHDSIFLQNRGVDSNSIDSIMLDESREFGTLSSAVLSCYWKAISNPLASAVLLSVILMQTSKNLSDAWLAQWIADVNPSRNDTNSTVGEISAAENCTHTVSYYLGIYTGIALGNSVITLARAFLFAYAGLTAAKYIHQALLNSVIYAKFYFFDITSVGRILNRFSSDTYAVDDSLPFILNILLAQVAGLGGAILISLYAMPWLGLVIIPMIPIYVNIQNRYRNASRDIKRLSSNALSPLYTQFTETLQGITIIRAMRGSQRFQRDFHVKLEESIKAQMTISAAQQWLGLRLQLLGALLVGSAGLLAAITSAHASHSSLVGLAISYALSVTGLLGGVLNALAETEQEMVAIERVNQYLQLEKENNCDGVVDPPFGWPAQGILSFEDVYMKYREHLSPALVNINFKTATFERVGIVGRTGAGKSSILAALLRVAPLASGEISVDCVNLKAISLRVLRDRIVIIPQEPFLFEGTVRDNLDPRGKYIDSEIWNAITNCLSTPLVQSLGGLNGRLERGGSNLSAGQKQLLCLTRALLKNSKIVCIDEGTSNLDKECEAAIQIVLKNAFKSSTVLFVSHRLKGLEHFDRIIVMDNGRIAEQGSPQELSACSDSIFKHLLTEQMRTGEK